MNEQFQEFLRCQESFTYFVTKYITILNPTKGLIPFELYEFQKRLIEIYEKHRCVAVIKFRQAGLTTLTVFYGLWKCMFHSNQSFFFASATEREAIHVGKLVDLAMQRFPDWFSPKMDKNTQTVKEFTVTGSRMMFGPMPRARGRSLTHLVIDEAAFMSRMEDYWKAAYPCLAESGKAFVVSTTNGVGNWFYDICSGGLAGTNAFHVVQPCYWEHPVYNNPEWVKNTRERLGEQGWAQEVLGEFVVGDMYISEYPKFTDQEILDSFSKLSLKKKLTEDDRALICEASLRFARLIPHTERKAVQQSTAAS